MDRPVNPDVRAMLAVVNVDQVLKLREVAVQAGLERLADACGDEIRRRSTPPPPPRRLRSLRRVP